MPERRPKRATPRTVRSGEATCFMEGNEFVRRYFDTGRITFGTSTLQAGARGEVDPGHPNSDEVFFVVTGHILLLDGDGTHHELFANDAILVPEGMPHTVINVGSEAAVLTWSAAPSP